MVKTGIKLATYFCVEAIKSKRKTWSRDTNSRLPFSVNVYLSTVWIFFRCRTKRKNHTPYSQMADTREKTGA